MKMFSTPFIADNIPSTTQLQSLDSLREEYDKNLEYMKAVREAMSISNFPNLVKLYEFLLDFYGNQAQKCLMTIELLEIKMKEGLPSEL